MELTEYELGILDLLSIYAEEGCDCGRDIQDHSIENEHGQAIWVCDFPKGFES